MCAKVSSKKSVSTPNRPTVAVGSRTPHRNTRQTPSKTQAKGKAARQQKNRSTRNSDNGSDNSDNESNNESNHESDNADNQSDNDANRANSSHSSDDSLDFLGRPPSHDPSESNVDETNGSANGSANEQSNRPPVHRPSTNQRRPRKQTKPKRKDRVTKEMMRLQASTKLLIPRLPFQRLVREVLQEYKNDFRMQSSTLECLQEAAESYLVQLFEDCYLCCLHRSRVTLTEKDVRLVQLLRGSTDVGRR